MLTDYVPPQYKRQNSRFEGVGTAFLGFILRGIQLIFKNMFLNI